MEPLPYQLRLILRNSSHCGATLLSPNIALTAFHCIAKNLGDYWDPIFGMEPTKDFVVYAGAFEYDEYKKDENRKNVQKRGIRKARPINNKDGSRNNISPDLAVLILDEPFEMNEFVTPACLPTREVPIGEDCIVSGNNFGTKIH